MNTRQKVSEFWEVSSVERFRCSIFKNHKAHTVKHVIKGLSAGAAPGLRSSGWRPVLVWDGHIIIELDDRNIAAFHPTRECGTPHTPHAMSQRWLCAAFTYMSSQHAILVLRWMTSATWPHMSMGVTLVSRQLPMCEVCRWITCQLMGMSMHKCWWCSSIWVCQLAVQCFKCSRTHFRMGS